MLRADNRALLGSRGMVIYLDVSLDNQYLRTSADRNRPLLQGGNLRQKLIDLRTQRDPIYREMADMVIDTDSNNPTQVARAIQRELIKRN